MTSEQRDLTPIVLGLCITVAGVILLLHNLGVVDAVLALRYWPAALVLIGGTMMWSSINGGKTTVPLGAIFWMVILGVVFNHAFARRQTSNAPLGPGQVNLFAVMGEDKPAPTTAHFSGGKVTAVLGGAQLDLRLATLAAGEEAVLDVFAMMGGATIRVPSGWNVRVDAAAVAGGINNRVASPAADAPVSSRSGASAELPAEASPPPPRLVIRGTVMMGGLNIRP